MNNEIQKIGIIRRIKNIAKFVTSGNDIQLLDNGIELQSGYVLFQEFLPGNSYDTRVTVIGDRAFA